MEHFNDLIINDDYYDLDDLNDNLDILKNIMNLRELNFKDNHQLIIQKELLLFLNENLPKFQPFFEKINSEIVE